MATTTVNGFEMPDAPDACNILDLKTLAEDFDTTVFPTFGSIEQRDTVYPFPAKGALSHVTSSTPSPFLEGIYLGTANGWERISMAISGDRNATASEVNSDVSYFEAITGMSMFLPAGSTVAFHGGFVVGSNATTVNFKWRTEGGATATTSNWGVTISTGSVMSSMFSATALSLTNNTHVYRFQGLIINTSADDVWQLCQDGTAFAGTVFTQPAGNWIFWD